METAERAEEGTTSVFEKGIMAVTGLILSLYVVFHLLGNLLFYAGPAVLDRYADALRVFPSLLWAVRLILLASFLLHVVIALRLAGRKRAARPIQYARRAWVGATLPSRFMLSSGIVLLLFVMLHLFHLTFGLLPGFVPGQVYRNVVLGFQTTSLLISYLVGTVALGLHMSHGLFSMTQSLGTIGRRRMVHIRRWSFWIAVGLALGFASIPIAVGIGFG